MTSPHDIIKRLEKAQMPNSGLPQESTGLRLGKVFADGRGLLCEAIRFPGGRDAVDTVLRRAAISGRVDIGGDIEDHFADVLDADASIIETVALDRRSYSALKNHWMRCKVEMVDPKPEPTHD